MLFYNKVYVHNKGNKGTFKTLKNIISTPTSNIFFLFVCFFEEFL